MKLALTNHHLSPSRFEKATSTISQWISLSNSRKRNIHGGTSTYWKVGTSRCSKDQAARAPSSLYQLLSHHTTDWKSAFLAAGAVCYQTTSRCLKQSP